MIKLVFWCIGMVEGDRVILVVFLIMLGLILIFVVGFRLFGKVVGVNSVLRVIIV